MDVLVPGVGEIIGGSQREERLDCAREPAWTPAMRGGTLRGIWTCAATAPLPHAGFGLGLERLVLYATGMENIRDAIPFPRTFRNNAAF